MLSKKVTVKSVTALFVVVVAVVFGQDTVQAIIQAISIFGAAQ